MRRLIISSRENEVLQMFFLKRGWGTSFFSEEITICLFFSEEIMRHLIFFWINNEVLGLVTSIILWMMLCLQWKNKVPHYFFRKNEVPIYFFRKNMKRIIISSEKMKLLIIASEKNEAPHYGFRTEWSTLLFLQ